LVTPSMDRVYGRTPKTMRESRVIAETATEPQLKTRNQWSCH